MWPAIIFVLIIYKLLKCLFFDDDVMDIKGFDSSALFTVAERLRKLCGGKVYVGLRIPDADSASRQSIVVVLVTEGELQVIAVKNFSRILRVHGDGSWVCEKPGSRHKVERHPNPVEEVRKQASILESYLELRGVALPKGYITCKVIIHPNPKLWYAFESPGNISTCYK